MHKGRLLRNRRYLFWTTYVLALATVTVVGALGGLIFGYAFDLPQVDELEQVRPSVVSHVYADDGRILGSFAIENRILVTYEQIPEIVKQSVLAAEDSSFFKHTGIDFIRLFKTVVRDIIYGERKGASTLTMQLSKLRFTSPEKTPARKIKDMLFAIEIEQNYSKEQIFTFYCNQIYLGHGNYGMAAAADYYFSKSLAELSLTEAALLAGIIQSPENYSPINHPERALSRRAYALRRLHEEGYIDEAAYRAALDEPLQLRLKGGDQSVAPYFVEEVRRYLASKYDMDKIWTGGLKVYTTVNYDFQVAATEAVRKGLLEFDKRTRPWRGVPENLLEKGQDLESFFHPEWRELFFEGQFVPGLVLDVEADKALVKIGTYRAEVRPEHIAWTRKKRISDALKVGDLATFRIDKLHSESKTIEAALERIPEVQGGLMALHNQTGAVMAMVGGFDFNLSKFNRSTQALRQPGSLFKIFTYTSAMESGRSPFDQVLDAPISFLDGLGRTWAPKNDDDEFRGLITIQQALAGSRNIPTVRLADAMGIDKVIDMAHRFGLRREFPPYLPVALGAGEVSLQEITSAFSVFPNGGVRALPWFIKQVEDYNGVTLEQNQYQVEEVISPETAGKMVYLLENVVKFGTGAQAGRKFNRPMAGKTGTTNDSTDVWFVGFVPQITAGVWVGYDQKKSLGSRVYGSNVALPIWMDFMEDALERLPAQEFDTKFVPTQIPGRQVAENTEPVTEPAAVRPTTAVPPAPTGGSSILEEDIPPPQ